MESLSTGGISSGNCPLVGVGGTGFKVANSDSTPCSPPQLAGGWESTSESADSVPCISALAVASPCDSALV